MRPHEVQKLENNKFLVALVCRLEMGNFLDNYLPINNFSLIAVLDKLYHTLSIEVHYGTHVISLEILRKIEIKLFFLHFKSCIIFN